MASVTNRQLFATAERYGIDTSDIAAAVCRDADGTPHVPYCRAGTEPEEKASLEELARLRSKCCTPAVSYSDSAHDLTLLAQAEQAAGRAERLSGPKRPSLRLGSAEALARAMRSALTDLARLAENGRSSAVRAAARLARERLEEAAAALQGVRSSPAAREALTAQLYAELAAPRRSRLRARARARGRAPAPRQLPTEPSPAEATLWIAGVVGVDHAPNKRASEVITTYAIKRDTNRALLCLPRLALDWLQRQCGPGTSWADSVYVTTAPWPDDEAVAELAWGLWDPDSEGPLTTMHGALEAAAALEGRP